MNIPIKDTTEGLSLVRKMLEAATQLAEVCADDPEFLVGWERSGTAAVIAEALTTLTGKKFTVAYNPSFIGGTNDIVLEETVIPVYTFVLMNISQVRGEPIWRAFALPQGSVQDYPVKEELVQSTHLMFFAVDEAAARAYVQTQFPNAKFWGDPK